MNHAIRRAANILDLPESELRFLQCREYTALASGLEAFKKICRERRRALAKKYHPDLGQDPERMKMINEAVDFIQGIRVALPPPRRIAYHVILQDAYASTSSCSAFSWMGGWVKF